MLPFVTGKLPQWKYYSSWEKMTALLVFEMIYKLLWLIVGAAGITLVIFSSCNEIFSNLSTECPLLCWCEYHN